MADTPNTAPAGAPPAGAPPVAPAPAEPVTLTPGTPEYDAHMAAIGDAGTVSKPDAPITSQPAARPDHIPEKFWDAEKGVVDMEAFGKSYGELEAKQSTPDPDDPLAGVEGIDYNGLGEYYLEHGSLTEQHYTDLASKGIPKEMVDAYLVGQQAVAQKTVDQAYNLVGGKEKYDAMMAWARANKSEEDLDKFDGTLAGESAGVMTAVKAMSQDYFKAVGTDGNLILGDNANLTGEVFADQDAVVAAMSDPRYQTDSAYRQSVIAKLARNDPFGIQQNDM